MFLNIWPLARPSTPKVGGRCFKRKGACFKMGASKFGGLELLMRTPCLMIWGSFFVISYVYPCRQPLRPCSRPYSIEKSISSRMAYRYTRIFDGLMRPPIEEMISYDLCSQLFRNFGPAVIKSAAGAVSPEGCSSRDSVGG